MPHQIPMATRLFARAVLAPIKRYHRFQVHGLHNVPATGGAMILMHHTLATYDAFLIGNAILDTVGRTAIGLGDDNLFRIPGVRQLCLDLGIRPARPETGAEALADGELLMLAPGGTREALRPSSQRNQPLWHDRFGFARLAIRMQVPVLVAGCPAGDDLYRVYDNPLTRGVYERFRWPLPVARGRGLTLIPRRVKLHGHISEPLLPPDTTEHDDDAVHTFHAALTARMTRLLQTNDS